MFISHQSRAIALYIFDKIYPSTFPNHSFPISILTLKQSLKKIGQKMLKIESRNNFYYQSRATINCTYSMKFTHLQPQIISTLIQSLRKIGIKILKIESKNKTDRLTLKAKF